MAQSQGAADGAAALGQVTEHLQPALGFLNLKAQLRVIYCDARGVISAVFQTGQSVQQNR